MSRLTKALSVIWIRDSLALLFLLGSALLVYSPALQGDILWDDHYLVRENPFFKSPIFFFEVFRHWLFLDSFSIYYRPVQNWSYMLDYWLWNTNSFGYHLTNILLHGLSGCLLFKLLCNILPGLTSEAGVSRDPRDDRGIAFMVSLVWVIHPVHNAAVAYIAGRADSLAALFALAAWLGFLKGRQVPSRGGKISLYAFALVLALVALCSKEVGLVWMELFTIALIFEASGPKPRPSARSVVAVCAALLGVVMAYYVLRSLPGPRTPLREDSAETLPARILLMLRALGDYSSLMLFPGDLHMERVVFSPATYATREVWEQNIRFEYLSIFGAATLALLAWVPSKNFQGKRLCLFSAVWFTAGFLPISNLFPLNAQVAEHWIYIPSIGFLLFLAGCAFALHRRIIPIATGLLVLAIFALGVRTALRSQEWANPEAFYKQTIRAGAGSARMYTNLGFVYNQRHDYVKAVEVLTDGVKRFPDFAPARINLGINLAELGRKDEARQYLVSARAPADSSAKPYPRTWAAAVALGRLESEDGKVAEAISTLDEAIKKNPDVWDLVSTEADILQKASRAKDAERMVEDYTARHWWHYDSYMRLSQLRLARSDEASAITALIHASTLNIHGTEPLNLIAQVDLKQKRPDAAYEAEMAAIRRDPAQPGEFAMLSVILDELGRKADAAEALRHAESLRRNAIEDAKAQ